MSNNGGCRGGCDDSKEKQELDALDREVCCLKSKIRGLEDKADCMQGDIEYYKGHLRHLQTLNDCMRKDLDDLRRQNSTLKWKKCDLEREIVRLNSTAECLRQRVAYFCCK